MEFGLNEILMMIDKVKSTELSLFEYQDADTKIKIRGAKSGRAAHGNRRSDAMEMRGDVYGNPGIGAQEMNGSVYGTPGIGAQEMSGSVYGTPGIGTMGVNADMRYAAAQSIPMQQGMQVQNGSPVMQTQETRAAQEAAGQIVSSPMVGTFYAAPSEDEAPFVQVGDTVKKGQTIGIVEAMKLMNEIESEYDGVVEEILVANEQMVEYGQPLIRVREV